MKDRYAFASLALALAAGCAVALGACASAGVLGPAPTQRSIKVDKWFAVVRDKVGDKCVVSVYPDTGDVQVRPGWEVGWVVVNRCDDPVSSLEFTFTFEDGSQKAPILFKPLAGGARQGRVRKPLFSKCDTESAPCGKYTYTVAVNGTTADPDFEIVEP